MSAPWNINDPYYDAPVAGLGARIKHRILLVRHGETDANRQLTSTNSDIDAATFGEPRLTDVGRRQAECIAARFSRWPSDAFTHIECSPMSRALETAVPFLRRIHRSVPVRVDTDLMELWHVRPGRVPYPWQAEPEMVDLLREVNFVDLTFVDSRKIVDMDNAATLFHHRHPESPEDAKARVAGLITRWRGRGTGDRRHQTIVFAHSLLIDALLNQLVAGSSAGACFHLANGSITCLDIDENDVVRVHLVNCTSHLTPALRTGHHTPL